MGNKSIEKIIKGKFFDIHVDDKKDYFKEIEKISENLLSNPVIQKQNGLNQNDVQNITNCLQSTGFRWGVTKEENETHSLSWCLDRWLLGLVLPERPGFAPGGLAPFSKGITINVGCGCVRLTSRGLIVF